MDKCLPFGASISCTLFQAVSDAIAFLVEFRTSKKIVNYLGDYLFVHFLKKLCDDQIAIFLEICASIHLPISEEKTFWSDTLMTFLGFLIDTVNQVVAIP